jgi:RNA polymerase sigma-54 factor
MNKIRLEQKQYQNLSPQQIQFLGLLQLPIVSLEKRIEEELEENPALDEDDNLEDSRPLFNSYTADNNFEDFQIEDRSESLKDYLVKQLVDLNLDAETLFLVNYLINSLEDNGFLPRNLYAISSDLLTNNDISVSESEILVALNILQTLEPIGVGAKDLQECLLLQLQKIYPTEKIAFKILSEFYTPFSNKNFEHIINKLDITKKKLKAVYNLIENLKPFPSEGFSKNSDSAKYIYADFSIIINNNELQIEINKGNIKPLTISRYYSDLLLETKDKETKKFLSQKLEKANWFKDCIQKRDLTLKLVMGAIIEQQKDYLISGIESDLRPMKLADIADIVNMDISTISRVSNSKFVETHFGTFKVKELFSDAFRKDNGEIISTKEIKHQLKEIIRNEDKLKPFTDDQLSVLLGKEEYHIARRTVAKYREQLGVDTAKIRREL